ncbi:hypothetical protein ANTQUA_LOCUS3582 [Anthophora quadrimaculata]
MEEQNAHFRHILLYYFRKGRNTSQAYKKLCAVYGNEALKERQCQNWFAKFRSGDFSIKMRNNLAVQLQLMRVISRPLSIEIVIA